MIVKMVRKARVPSGTLLTTVKVMSSTTPGKNLLIHLTFMILSTDVRKSVDGPLMSIFKKNWPPVRVRRNFCKMIKSLFILYVLKKK